MTAPHDLRLAGAAAAAWLAVACVLNAVPLGWVAGGALAIAATGSAAVAYVARFTGRSWQIARAGIAIVGLAAWCGMTAGVAAHLWLSSTRDGGRDEAVAAATVLVEATTVDTGRTSASGDVNRCMTAVTLAAWRPASDEASSARNAWRTVESPASLDLDGCVPVGTGLTVRVDLDEGDKLTAGPLGWDAEILQQVPPGGALATLREGFETATAHLPDESRGLVRGMITGDTASMSEAQVEAMRQAGVAHVTAVSGAHFAMLTVMALLVLRALSVPRAVQAGGLVVAVVSFALFVGPAPSVLRALGLALAVGAGLAWGRRARAMPALAACVLVLVHVRPRIALEIGFAMSVTAVLAIVLVAPAIAVRLTRWMTPRLASAVSVPVAAQLALLPFLVVLQPGVGPYAVLANLAAVVFLTPVMIGGLAAVVIAPWSLTVAQMCASLAAWPATVMVRICDAVVALPGAWLPWPEGGAGIAFAAGVAVAGLVACSSGVAAVRLCAGVSAVLVTWTAVGPQSPLRHAVTEDWRVVACDVGQGDMLLLRAGPQSAVIIDTGPDPVATQECLDRHQIREVPLLILTHPDHDHDGAVGAVLGNAEVTTAWVAQPGIDGTAASALRNAGVEVTVPADGHRFETASVVLEVLPGSQDGQPSASGDNDASIVVLASVSGTRLLALGDLEPAAQARLVRALRPHGPVSVDAVKVAHHGSAHQDPELAEMIDADWAIFSAGADNDYGHPAPAALEMYSKTGAVSRVTATCGDIALTARGVATARQCHTDMAR
ncbi:ComEC/Rec2 family competence protein [Demequina flava]|uniref:ComEC/Rec2 family competence protein n=1 Tax=Demequina flava TaxID=1095025 RepID=UPI000784272F|nr:ComEC/Rec2 family competence protein [Demequina flava]